MGRDSVNIWCDSGNIRCVSGNKPVHHGHQSSQPVHLRLTVQQRQPRAFGLRHLRHRTRDPITNAFTNNDVDPTHTVGSVYEEENFKVIPL